MRWTTCVALCLTTVLGWAETEIFLATLAQFDPDGGTIVLKRTGKPDMNATLHKKPRLWLNKQPADIEQFRQLEGKQVMARVSVGTQVRPVVREMADPDTWKWLEKVRRGVVKGTLIGVENNYLIFEFPDKTRFAYKFTPKTRFERDGTPRGITMLLPIAADLGAGRGATVQALLDAADSKTASTIDSYLTRIVAAYSEEARVRLARTAGTAIASAPRIDARLRAWYNTDLRNENYLVPGVLCLILLVIATQLTSLAIVREREKDLFR